LLAEMKERGERHEQGQGVKSRAATLPKLSDLGVSKTQSSRWQKLATDLTSGLHAASIGRRGARLELARRRQAVSTSVKSALLAGCCHQRWGFRARAGSWAPGIRGDKLENLVQSTG
jgi:hypothetical protein